MLKPLTVLDPSKLTPEDCAALRRDGFSVHGMVNLHSWTSPMDAVSRSVIQAECAVQADCEKVDRLIMIGRL